MTTLGYARVSTLDQTPALQLDALRAAGCAMIFEEHESGAKRDRPQLALVLEQLQPGDTLLVWRLDRLGRSLPHLIEILTGLKQRGIEFKSLHDNIDTTTATGRLIFHIMGALAEFERGLLIERTNAGLQSAKRRGVKLGRRPILKDYQLDHARQLIQNGSSPKEVARTFRVGRSTLYRALGVTQ